MIHGVVEPDSWNDEPMAEEHGPPAHPDVWHVGWNGPRCCTLLRLFGEQKRAIVQFNGVLEIVESDDVYETEQAAYTAAWLKQMEQAGKAMKQAEVYKKRADELRAK